VDTREVGRYWESNARAWTTLSRQGWDVYRDALNTPAFLELLPDIGGRSGLDLGCGEGHNTRLLAARGARIVGVDLVPTFIEYAREAERESPLGIQYSIERIAEPHADEETARRVPHIADTRIVAYYLHVRCRKGTSP
jgi:2-polyprenyl-3-methyl-5-hydroxy-6-metoxy-1,4-benzoquinol methylase